MARKSSRSRGASSPAFPWRKLAKWTGVLFGSAYGVLVVTGLFSDRLIHHPPRPATYRDDLAGVFRMPLPGGGDVAALWIPRPGAKTAILCFHGNADDLGWMRARAIAMSERTGCPVLAIDYPGYGRSPGEPDEAAVIRAADAAYAHLVRVRGFAPDDIVVRGLSLGSGPATWIAAHRRVKGLILDAPFTSTFRVLTRVKLLPFDKFDNLALADRVQCPVLIVHGDADSVVPFSHGRELAAAMTGAASVRFLPLRGVGHEIAAGNDTDPRERAEVARIVAGGR